MDDRVSSRTDHSRVYRRVGAEPGEPSERRIPDPDDHTVGISVYRDRIVLEVDS